MKTVQRVENAEITPRAKTLGGLDRAAEWEPGSARRALAGGDPTPLESKTALTVEQKIAQIRAAVADGVLDAELGQQMEDYIQRQEHGQADPFGRFGVARG